MRSSKQARGTDARELRGMRDTKTARIRTIDVGDRRLERVANTPRFEVIQRLLKRGACCSCRLCPSIRLTC